MCGIAGILRQRRGEEERARVQRMLNLMRHRGPDDNGIYGDNASGFALGHARLSIIDLSASGHQPMFGEDESICLAFNGEVYNFLALRRELESKGHRFRSKSDSEVIVHGFEEWGDAIVQKLQGMFAFALWDATNRRLLLARDPMGMKPLYLWWSPSGAFHFASEIKAFLGLPDFHPSVNPRTLRQFLEFNFITDPEEASLEGVRKLPPAHALVVSAEDVAAGRRPTPRRYYSPPAIELWGGGLQDHDRRVEHLGAVLEEVVGQHLVADVPVAILLSGGLDSSLVAALAARKGPVRTITMAFADSQVDERQFARRAQSAIGSTHEEVVIRPDEVAADLPETVWWFDDLFGDWGLLSTRILYKRCRELGIKVVLVGEGSDELFGGYPSYRFAAGPESGRSGFSRRALRLYQWYSGRRYGSELRLFFRTLRELHREAHADWFATVRLFETRHQLPQNYNMKVDKAAMSVGVEARVPFLDVRVANEGYRTPGELLLAGGTDKLLLREVAERHGLLPSDVARRPKFGGSIAASWMDDVPGFRSLARDVVLDRGGWATAVGLRGAMESYFLRGRAGYPFPHPVGIFSILAWRLLLLNLWSQRYTKGEVAVGKSDAA